MPAPDSEFIVAPATPGTQVALEPAQNGLNSLMLLNLVEQWSGLDEWVTRTAGTLTPQQRENNRIVLNGLYFATVPDRSWPSFPAYVDHMAALNPVVLRNRLFNAYFHLGEGVLCCAPDPAYEAESGDVAPLLASFDRFVEFLLERFSAEKVHLEVESQAHRYLNDPPAMQSFIVSHLRTMWEEVLSSEWERSLPMLQASLDAFQQIDLGKLTKAEAARRVLGRELEDAEKWQAAFDQIERLTFVPSTHVGPYLTRFRFGDTLWVLFGARIPEGVQVHAPDLTRAEILVRLNALSDDTRLRILRLIAEEGEMHSQDIMAGLELSQSATSRHLKQLSAAGYLSERRCSGAKCYRLNPGRIEETLRQISAFLSAKHTRL